MHPSEKVVKINPDFKETIIRFIRDYVGKVKAKGVVLGISGGIDSATAAVLSIIALGGDRVLGIYMPEAEVSGDLDFKHIKLLSKKYNFRIKTIDITDPLRTVYNTIPDYDHTDKLCRGNLKARMRMMVLYYYANLKNLIVVGSSDKSETMIGYFTKWGDSCADISPLMDLYKIQVRQLALQLDIPEAIVQKQSTPGLWLNQTAEKEIGLKYETLDFILYRLEHFTSTSEIARELNLPLNKINKIKNKWLQTEHKRRMPLTIKLGYRTVNADFRLNQIS